MISSILEDFFDSVKISEMIGSFCGLGVTAGAFLSKMILVTLGVRFGEVALRTS